MLRTDNAELITLREEYMKVSLNWLNDYVDIRTDVSDLVNLLTMAGLEVEGTTLTGEGFEKVVVAEIDSIRKHPAADRLSLVDVKTDREKYAVVCGATNIRKGQKIPLALAGARLPNGMEIRRSKIRGVASEGMLCSETELGLGADASGIMILSSLLRPGENFGEALGLKDTVLEIGITPNRPDCLCVIGVAREISALTHQKMRYPSIPLLETGDDIHRKTSVTILDPDLCPRYVARMIEGVKIGPSPQWMRSRLEKVGVRSISNVVDVTNYVMMEYGQPLHAFDFELLEEGRIVVRRARNGEEFVTLDDIKRTLDSEMLMICDGVKPVAVAGVMGGLNSEISNDTKIVLLESAYFDPASNRETSRKLGLETEASYRFGRGIDYGGCVSAANRAAQLIQELAGGRVMKGVVDAYPIPLEPKPIRLRVSRTRQILGTEVAAKDVETYLKDLGLEVHPEGENVWVVTPPSFRRDLEREIDLIEEIARMDGYEKIPVTLPQSPPSPAKLSRELLLERKASEVLIRYGYHEVVNYSFTSPSSWDLIGLLPDDPKRRHLAILNPLSEDLSVLRTSLLPGLLETARYNVSRKILNLKLFELRKLFLPEKQDGLPRESKSLGGIAMGADQDLHWASAQRPIDFFDIKGCVEDLLESLQIEGIKFRRDEDSIPFLHPGKAAKIFSGEEMLGVLGEAHPEVLERYEIPGRAYLFEINFDQLVKRAGEKRWFKPLPRFPVVYRDLSLVIDDGLEAQKIVEAIKAFQNPYMDEVILFDIYHGTPIPEGKKGVSFRIRYQASERTLTDEEVNEDHERLISRLKEMFQAELRS